MRDRIRHVLFLIARLILVVLIGGATYQGVATALERRDFPAPGNKVDVGGHQLHIYCSGKGSPAVILEAPATGMSAAWAWVQPEVAKYTRVCSYDRAGLGWSEAGDRPYDPRNVAPELHALLAGAHVAAPYVVVGESLGAAFARLYAASYPAEVTAAVLVDDPTPGNAGDAGDVHTFTRLLTFAPWLARTGLLRATRLLSNGANGLPEPARGAVQAFLNRPDHLTRSGRELARWDETLTLASGASLPAGIRMQAVNTNRTRPGSLLTDATEAARVTSMILEVARNAR